MPDAHRAGGADAGTTGIDSPRVHAEIGIRHDILSCPPARPIALPLAESATVWLPFVVVLRWDFGADTADTGARDMD
jgi:hypothetical protein